MFAVSGDRWSGDLQERAILFDSGSDDHVCGHGFAPTAPTRETTNHTTKRDAQGNIVHREQSRDVKIKTDTGNTFTFPWATFEIADVKGAIHAGNLVKKGSRAVLDRTEQELLGEGRQAK